MQREDVERLCAPIEKIVNYEYSSRDALIHNCDLGTIDMGQLQDLCAALRALLAERDAAFAAGQEDRDAMVEAIQDTLLDMNVWPDAGTEAVARAAADDLLAKGWRRRVKGGEV